MKTKFKDEKTYIYQGLYIKLQFSHVLYILLLQIHFTETKQLKSYKSTLSMDLLFKEHLLGYTV